jgi:ankyrin repeat protein
MGQPSWSAVQGYYGWTMDRAAFRELIEALWQADVDRVAAAISATPAAVHNDELLQTATRPPGHWHNGHGGLVPPDIGRDTRRATVVRWLVGAGADVNQRSRRRRDTGLHHAARYGLVQTAGAMLDLGVDPDIRAKDGATALLRAVRLRYRDVATLLLARGADDSIPDRKGKTARDLAVDRGWNLEAIQEP